MTRLPAVVSSAVMAFVSEGVSNGEVISSAKVDGSAEVVSSGEVISSAEVDISGEVDTSTVLVGSPVLVMLVRCGGLDVPVKEVISVMAMDAGMDMKNGAGQLTGEENMELCPVILGLPAVQSGLGRKSRDTKENSE